jgi:two-component system, OmpR family, response regulator RstA
MNGSKILLVDDDQELTALIGQFLTSNGFAVMIEHDGHNIMSYIQGSEIPDLIILDLMLPGKDGLTICKEIRELYQRPIVMLTALDDDIDEVTGLEVGADDYLAKPVKPRVLLAHIRAQLRMQERMELLDCEATSQEIKTADLTIDDTSRSVTLRGDTIDLTSAEFDLLWLLAQHIGSTVSRESLHQQIFKLEFDGLDRSIDLRISRIRKKLGEDPKSPRLIKTVRNKGYLLVKQ